MSQGTDEQVFGVPKSPPMPNAVRHTVALEDIMGPQTFSSPGSPLFLPDSRKKVEMGRGGAQVFSFPCFQPQTVTAWIRSTHGSCLPQADPGGSFLRPPSASLQRSLPCFEVRLLPWAEGVCLM